MNVVSSSMNLAGRFVNQTTDLQTPGRNQRQVMYNAVIAVA